MKYLVLLLLVVVVSVFARPEDKKPEKVEDKKPEGKKADVKYTTKFDNVDLDQVIKNERLLRNYVNCLLEKGKCSADGTELKKALPDALHSNCSKCSEKQKEGSKRIIHYLIDNKRDVWNQLEAKYDKKGEYKKKYDAELKKEGIKLSN